MKKSRGFALVETLIVSTIIATILIYVFVQFNTLQGKYDESFKYNDVDDLYKLDSIKGYIKSLDNTSITNIINKITSDDIIIMDKEDNTYTDITYFDNHNVDTSSLSKNMKDMIKKIDNKSDNYRIIAEFNNGNLATITISLEVESNE